MKTQKFETDINGKKITAEISNITEQANGSVFLRIGDTVLLATAVMGNQDKDSNFLPLTVEYEEKFYAAGKILGSRFVKREGRPSDVAILNARLIDRTIRPRFNKNLRRDIQVVSTVLSLDEENDPDVNGILAGSLALSLSNIPWNGPVAGVRIAFKNGEFLVDPTFTQREGAELEIVFSGTEDKINMIEAEAEQINEEIIIKAAEIAKNYIKKLIEFQKQVISKINPQKADVALFQHDEEIKKSAIEFLKNKLESALYEPEKIARVSKIYALKKELFDYLKAKGFEDSKIKQTELILEDETDVLVHKNIQEKDKRPDGRKLNEIRPIEAHIELLPRTHGSALFMRGLTHILSVVTLGAPGDVQMVQGMEFRGTKRFMHHYNFPPYSVGETGPFRGPGRREIGHGTLAEKALTPVIPEKEEFPYTIRVVSETLSSNGSSSMGSVCASSLALMQAGVPIKNAVAGISVGLITNGKQWKLLTDIQGPEDHYGDMDFKIAGTKKGVTAIQLDVKIDGITDEILSAALAEAKRARLEILEKVDKVIDKPRPELSPLAPRILQIKIDPEKIRFVIGPGGKNINEITETSGAQIDIEDDGLIFITAENVASAEKAREMIDNLTKEFKVGDIVSGKVSRIMDFGAIVDISPVQDGFLHISEIEPRRIEKISDVLKLGQEVKAKVIRVEEDGKIGLSIKALLDRK